MSQIDAYTSGSTEPWTVSVLQALIRLRRPKRLLELGTFEGRTTQAMAEAAAPFNYLITVDQQDQRAVEVAGVNFVKTDALTWLYSTKLGGYDFVYVDDDHTFSHVEEEVDLLMGGIVSSGGLIVLHDVIGPFGLDQIVKERGGFIIDLPLLHAAGGLGVIEVP